MSLKANRSVVGRHEIRRTGRAEVVKGTPEVVRGTLEVVKGTPERGPRGVPGAAPRGVAGGAPRGVPGRAPRGRVVVDQGIAEEKRGTAVPPKPARVAREQAESADSSRSFGGMQSRNAGRMFGDGTVKETSPRAAAYRKVTELVQGGMSGSLALLEVARTARESGDDVLRAELMQHVKIQSRAEHEQTMAMLHAWADAIGAPKLPLAAEPQGRPAPSSTTAYHKVLELVTAGMPASSAFGEVARHAHESGDTALHAELIKQASAHSRAENDQRMQMLRNWA